MRDSSIVAGDTIRHHAIAETSVRRCECLHVVGADASCRYGNFFNCGLSTAESL